MRSAQLLNEIYIRTWALLKEVYSRINGKRKYQVTTNVYMQHASPLGM